MAQSSPRFGMETVAQLYFGWVAKCLPKAFHPTQQAPTEPAEVLTSPENETKLVAAMKQDLHMNAQHLLDRAHEAHVIHTEIALDDVRRHVRCA